MDNLTHSLAGLAVGEFIHRTLAPEPDAGAHVTRHRMLLVSCWAANNIPDLDLLLSDRLPAPIGYLLHHRGHTHTLLFAIPQAVLLMALVWLLWPGARRLLHASQAARAGLVVASALGLVMHIGFDFLNSYGVHPFYPVDARWLYGDTLFILEPVMWVSFGAPLLMLVGRRWLRAGFALLFVAIIAASLVRGFLHWGSAGALVAAAAALAMLHSRSDQRGRLALLAGMLAAGSFIGIQAQLSASGKQLVAAQVARLAPQARVLDVAMTGFPANPLCWSFLSVERDDTHAVYRLRRGLFTPFPRLMAADACPPGFAMPPVSGTPQLGFAWVHEARLADLRALASHCRGRAWLRFARMPALWPQGVTDARFSAAQGSNFSTMALDGMASLSCPPDIPAWDIPRSDLLETP